MRPAHYQTRFKAALTPRQKEVAELLASGKTNAEIANALNLGWETVKSHVSEILMKLEVDTREAAAERLRHERSFGSALTRPFRALLAFGPGKLIGGAIAVSFGVVAVTLLLTFALPSERPPNELTEPDLPVVVPGSVDRLGSVSTCCVAHQITATGTAVWLVTGANVTNWQSQMYRLDQAGGTLSAVNLDIWPLVLASSPEGALWASRPESYDFSAPRDVQRDIPGPAGSLSRISLLETTGFDELISFTAPARVSQLKVDVDYVWAVSVLDNLILQFDARSGREHHRFHLERIGEATIEQSNLWVTLPRLDRIVRLNATTGEIDLDLAVPVECVCAARIVSTDGLLWVTQYARDSLLRIDAAAPADIREVKTEPGPNQIGVGADGSLWVVFSGLDGMTLAQLEPRTASVIRRHSLGTFGGSADGIVITSEAVWVTGQKGEIVRVTR